MRVISGTARGARLRAAKGNDTRPTADRVKENLFNILAPDVEGCKFLDLFGGTGAIGIEALSRGAELAVFVENSAEAARVINYNLSATGLGGRSRILCIDFKKALTLLAKEGSAFDIIFLDPPYGAGLAEEALSRIARLGILKDGGYAAVETGSDYIINPGEFEIFKTRSYGAAAISLMRPNKES